MRPLILVALLLGASLVTGCAGLAPPGRAALRADGPLLRATLDMAARQVRRCYRSPRVSSAGRQIVTRLRVRVAPDGTLGDIPWVISQSGVGPQNQAYAERMAQAAIQSVLQCAPLSLPADAYRGAVLEIELTFSPLAAA